MSTQVSIVFDSNQPGDFLPAYSVSFAATDHGVTDALLDAGPVENNRVFKRGVFRNERDAAQAVVNYVGTPCKLLGVTPWMGTESFRLVAHQHGATFSQASVRVLASRNRAGTFVADAR
jgi:hypothetical protein